MKRASKLMAIIIMISIVLTSCNKDDDNLPAKSSNLSAIKYGSKKLEGKVNNAFSSKVATVLPKNASVSFKISRITKDKQSFTNPQKDGFKINSKGMVSASKNHKLVAGTYVLTITATSKKDKGTSKNTTLTIVVSETIKPIASIKYESGNKLEGKQKVALNSKNAIIEPKDVPVSFTISKISKDKKSFKNPKSGGFKINGKGGKISLPNNHVLKAGTYVLEVLGFNKKNKKDKRKIQVTVEIK